MAFYLRPKTSTAVGAWVTVASSNGATQQDSKSAANSHNSVPLMSNMLPARFNSTAIRRYEPYIKIAITKFPDPVVFRPNGLSPETFACRFRDALKALRNGWGTSTQIDMLKLAQCGNDLVVSLQQDGTVRVGPKEHKAPPIDVDLTSSRQGRVVPKLQCTTAVLTALVILKSSQVPFMEGPIELESVDQIPESTIQMLTNTYDVEIVPNEKGATLV